MSVLIIPGLWALSLLYTERDYTRQSALIDTAENIAYSLKNGICESRMCLSEILYEAGFPYRNFHSFLEENNAVLDITDDTVSSVKSFEEQSVYLSVNECEKLITDLCGNLCAQLLNTRKEMKNRLMGMRTVISAFFLILLILLV